MEDLELYYERKMKDGVIAKRLLKYTTPHIWYFIWGLIVVFISVPLAAYNPILIKNITDNLVSRNIDINLIAINVIMMIIIMIVNAFAIYFMFYLLQKAGQKINQALRLEVFSHIEKLSANQFNLTPVGKLVSRVTNDVDSITQLYSNLIVGFLKNGLTALVSLIYIFALVWNIDILLGICAVIVMPLLIVATIIFRKVTKKAYREARTYNTEVNSFLSEHLSGVKITQIFNKEDAEVLKFKEKTNKHYKSNMKSLMAFSIFRPFIYFLQIISIVLVLYYGGNLIIEGVMTFGVLTALYDYLFRFYDPVQQISEQFDVLQSSFASAEKIFNILDTKPEIEDFNYAQDFEKIKGEIEFKNVWFAYNNEDWILKDISFKIKENEVVAFVGETGSGKTTILSLITRNYDIQKGQILIDGIDLKKYKLDFLRSNISQMLQDVFLFSGTIESNIKLKDDVYSDEEMVEAAKFVNADKFINRLPNKYQEEVRERGNNFSSGQRQLISFARAILHKPRIIILDEATANIDTETEILIKESLEKIMSIGTMLMVAHRLSTIQNADKIIVLNKGEIIESGNHKELLDKEGYYHKMYLLQFAEEDKIISM